MTKEKSNNDTSRRNFLKAGLATGAGLLATGQLNTQSVSAAAARKGLLNADRHVLFEHIEKIYSDGQWNGRPALVYWKGHYYNFFRAGSGHGGYDGRVMMMKSKRGEPSDWTTTKIIDTPRNEAEAHVLVTENRIFIYIVIEQPDNEAKLETLVTYSDDGKKWTKPERMYDLGYSVWKPHTVNGVHYMAADLMVGHKHVRLLKSTDGLNWETVSTIVEGKRYTETALVTLKDDTMVAITRQSKVSFAKPPYTEWTTYDGISLGGPAAAVVGDTLIVSGRVGSDNYPDNQPGPARTGLFTYDDTEMKYRWKTNLVTQWGMDVSYPHILPLDDERALLTWYDGKGYEKGVTKQADIFLATVRVV